MNNIIDFQKKKEEKELFDMLLSVGEVMDEVEESFTKSMSKYSGFSVDELNVFKKEVERLDRQNTNKER